MAPIHFLFPRIRLLALTVLCAYISTVYASPFPFEFNRDASRKHTGHRPIPAAPSPRPYTPQFKVFSSTNISFKALPPMSNPNRPIYLTNPTFEGDSTAAGNEPRAKPTTDETRHGQRKLPAITRVDPQNGMFYDEHDRVRIFRGMAISYKVAPFMPTIDSFNPINSFAEDDLRLFDKLNLNVIRLGISWAACQPRRGPDGFDLEYLARLRQLVKKSEEYGLYVIIEYHQDLYAEKFTGDGAPSWAISKDWNTLPFPMPISGWKRAEYDDLLGPDGAPTNMNYTDSWGFHYVSDAVIRSFWGLYTNYDGIQDEFIGFWGKLAETFSGMDNVVGYELFNEPFVAARSTFHWPISWLFRDRTDTNYLQPMYDRIEAEIRKHDERGLIFYEPVCGSGGSLGDGFTKTPGDRPDKAVFSFHSYGPNVIDSLTMDAAIAKGVSQAKRLGGGRMLTEWDVEYVQGPRRIKRVLELADKEKLSWIGWQFKQFARVAGSPPHGTIVDPRTGVYRPGMCKLFSRPYPTAVSGTLDNFHFNWTTSELHVTVTPNKSSPNATTLPDKDGEIVISVTEEEEWGWSTPWRLLHVDRQGERIGHKRVQKEDELEKEEEGVRWWVERSWVEGSKLIKIRLGTDWEGPATVVVGMEDAKVLEEATMFDQHWDFNGDHPFNETLKGWDWRPRM